MKISKLTGLGITIIRNNKNTAPAISFYSLDASTSDGTKISFEKYKGKKILIVNLASECGFTPQYSELEKLHKEGKLIVLGFPSNDFRGQEPGSDAEIANFCAINFGVSFQLFKKGSVKGLEKQEVYQWLTDPTQNGWNQQAPNWNFYKYLINEEGILTAIYSSSVSPNDILLNY